eukprot:gene12874-12973_t
MKIIEMWQEGGGNTLVKVMPRHFKPEHTKSIGYCTTIKFVAGRTPEEMEIILGFKAGSKLMNGAGVYRVDPLPSPDQFEFRSYSYLPAGVPQIDGKVLNPDYPPGSGAPQWELTEYPQSGLRLLAELPLVPTCAKCRFDRLIGSGAKQGSLMRFGSPGLPRRKSAPQ